MARAFAEQGMKLVLLDIDDDKLEIVRSEFEKEGVTVSTWVVDTTEKDSVCEAVRHAREALGSINIVCANAGVSGVMKPLNEIRVEDWDWIIDVNIKGSVYTVQACIPYLLENPGEAHIVITSSISGLRVHEPSRNQGLYNTTKYAMVGFGEALKVDLAPLGVGVSILCPGVVNTDISHSARNRPKKYGGALETSESHDLAKLAASGTAPLVFGRWVVRAVENNRLHVITHPEAREQVAARHERILKAFDDSSELTG